MEFLIFCTWVLCGLIPNFWEDCEDWYNGCDINLFYFVMEGAGAMTAGPIYGLSWLLKRINIPGRR